MQVGKFIQLTSTFFGGFIIAFIKGWLLSLVMLSIIPPLVIAGGIMALVISKMASRGQEAYAEAANVVEQAIGSIRTVRKFLSFLKKRYKITSMSQWKFDHFFFYSGCFFYRRENCCEQIQKVSDKCLFVHCSRRSSFWSRFGNGNAHYVLWIFSWRMVWIKVGTGS